MINNRLKWQSLLPDVSHYKAIFDDAAQMQPVSFITMQPRLKNALAIFCHPRSSLQFMLLQTQEIQEYLALLSNVVQQLYPQNTICKNTQYVIKDNKINLEVQSKEPLITDGSCVFQEWVEPEQLFGCVKLHNDIISLQPGLIHHANGGVLILSAYTLLAQPLLWLRLKQMITQRQFYWVSLDEKRPIPVTIPPMPLELRLIIVGNHHRLADFKNIEPELSEHAIYGECEDYLQLTNIKDMIQWCGYVNNVLIKQKLPPLATDTWPLLIRHAIRYSGDHSILPLSLMWIRQQLSEAALYTKEKVITAIAFQAALSTREWRNSYLEECALRDIKLGQLLIATEGEIIGQINGLSILDYPGHPLSLGEPLRISCVVHLGEGDFIDVERKSELGGNLHAKSIMIIQAFMISELKLDRSMPFSASIVFEQSYGEVDGDSASLAELCALISALAQKPINQQIAVTGSVDQFGNVQPIGGVNEKTEGFFKVCLQRGLTGKQGVIIPQTNMRNLCLSQDVINAVRKRQFHIWAVNTVAEALPLLTGYTYADTQYPNLLSAIRKRILHLNPQQRYYWPRLLHWLPWFSRN
ncbi:Lon-like ATP-dependent protease [Serratia symbiotica str. 'Cinara cedri']|nr:Lon-like ATP-dependent protease [Serratia symbiotica str. 'Cinara cedri']